MRALWPLREATVRQIQLGLASYRPRAYTTVMTIMVRLAHKGIVARRKVGRAWLYAPNVSAEQARAFALGQLVENFFDGSEVSLKSFLSGQPGPKMDRSVLARVLTISKPPAETQDLPSHGFDDTLL